MNAIIQQAICLLSAHFLTEQIDMILGNKTYGAR